MLSDTLKRANKTAFKILLSQWRKSLLEVDCSEMEEVARYEDDISCILIFRRDERR